MSPRPLLLALLAEAAVELGRRGLAGGLVDRIAEALKGEASPPVRIPPRLG